MPSLHAACAIHFAERRLFNASSIASPDLPTNVLNLGKVNHFLPN